MTDDPKEEARRKALRRHHLRRPEELGAGARAQAPKREPKRDRPETTGGLAAFDDTELERLPTRARHGGRRSEALAGRAEKARAGKVRAAAAEPAAVEPEAFLPGEALVVAITRGECDAELGGETLRAHVPKALSFTQGTDLAVGDRVRLARREAGELVVARIEPRRNRLSRPDPFLAHRERILAANLDLAVVVAAVRKPPFAPGLVDRFLVALAHGGVPAALAVNKIDLVPEDRDDDLELEALADYRALGIPVVLTSTKSGEGLAELSALVRGGTAVFVGHSGVGKSSLLAAVAPGFDVRVGEVSTLNDRGRHTTTRSRVYRLDDGVTRIVDTPGIREFGLWKLGRAELADLFDDFAPFAPHCRFTDCSHSHEPACAVEAAVENGDLSVARYATYLRILESLGER